jgi:hypothetical protein
VQEAQQRRVDLVGAGPGDDVRTTFDHGEELRRIHRQRYGGAPSR